MVTKKVLALSSVVILLLLSAVVVFLYQTRLRSDLTNILPPSAENLAEKISNKSSNAQTDKDSFGITKTPMGDGSILYRVQGRFTSELSEKFSFLSANFLISGLSNNKEIPVFLVGNSGKMNFGRTTGKNGENTVWTLTSGEEIKKHITTSTDVELSIVVRPKEKNSENRQKMLEKIISEKNTDPDTALVPEMIRIL